MKDKKKTKSVDSDKEHEENSDDLMLSVEQEDFTSKSGLRWKTQSNATKIKTAALIMSKFVVLMI